MPEFLISKADVTTGEMLLLVDNCKNNTVGPNKYQLYCQTASDLDGSCKLLPSSFTSAGSLNCRNVISQTYLQNLYDVTGMACAVNCYYPLDTVTPPLADLPSYTYSYPSRTYSYSNNYPSGTELASTTKRPVISASGGIISNNGAPSIAASTTLASGSNTMDPSFIFTIMSMFAIMALFVRRAI
jgi:hypothetical protein